MRYAAIACFVFIPLIWSSEKVKAVRLRALLFQEICHMLATVKIRLQFDNPTTGELVFSLCRDEGLKRLKFLRVCFDSLKGKGESFNKIWEQAVREDDLIKKYLPSEDISALVSFGNNLGTTDTACQLEFCEKCIGQFEERRAAAFCEKTRLGKMYVTLGMAGAFALLILLI